MKRRQFLSTSIISIIAGTAYASPPLKRIATGYTWAEGPVETPDGSIYFTDNREDKLHVIKPDGTIQLFLGPGSAHKANGMYLDSDGALIACTGDPKALVKIAADGSMTTLVDSFEGAPFNAPNDCYIDKKGGIYFTDPFWGKTAGRSRVYYLAPDRITLTPVIAEMIRPNGVVGSPDGKTLYVSDWDEKVTYAYSVNPDGSLWDKRQFAAVGDDGMTVDAQGNVYLTGKVVSVYSPTGKLLGEIETPETPANVIFAGKDKKTLVITARTSVYAVEICEGTTINR